MRGDLPSGTVTFLFTDVEASTRLLREVGVQEYAEALAAHRRIFRQAFSAHGGVEVDTQGDAFFVAFPTALGAVRAAAEALQKGAGGPISVRIGIHTGTPHAAEEGYVGADVHRAARIAACGHGGQVLISASTASLVGTEEVRDLGWHRLKDLSAPERIYQLGYDDFPPLRSLHQTNLPIPATTFLGREREVPEVTALLGRDEVRLVTLTGPGGSGKTRLALQCARAAGNSFEDGIWWVPLAPLRDPTLVLEVAAQSLGATIELAEHIGDKRLLLLLDNFEHVVAAAPEVARLLRLCPRLAVLVTSRESLRLEGEWEYAVDPLSEAEAVALFETRARAMRRDFVTGREVHEICARLDNLPLAIELAAARVKVLLPPALLERLETRLPMLEGGMSDAPARQQTLRATVEWSYELLGETEKRLFVRLAVFAGGWVVEAAERICDSDLYTLQALVDKSLIREIEGRFEMLETIQEYALERLEQSGEANKTRLAHADYFITSAETQAREIPGRGGAQSVAWLQAEHGNTMAALGWLVEAGHIERALRLGAALSFFWLIRGGGIAGTLLLERALQRADSADPHRRATAQVALSRLLLNEGEVEQAHALAEESRRRSEELGDRQTLLRSLLQLEWTTILRGERDRASRLCEESLQLAVELGDRNSEGVVYSHMAGLALPNDLADTRRLREAALRCWRESGNDAGVSGALNSLGWLDLREGKVDRAEAHAEEALHVARRMDHQAHVASSLELLGWIAVDRVEVSQAMEHFGNCLALNVHLGDKPEILDCIEAIGALAVATEPSVAARLLAAAESKREKLGLPPPAEGRTFIHTQVAACRARLSEEEFKETWHAGGALTIDDAVQLTRGLCP